MNVNEIPWEEAPEGYDLWIVPAQEYADYVKPDFHKYVKNYYLGYTAYVDSRGRHWDAVGLNKDFFVYERPKAVEESIDSSWYVDGKAVKLPPVGEEVEFHADYMIHIVKILAHAELSGGTKVAVFQSENMISYSKSGFSPVKKEPSVQEKLLEKWRMRGIDFAYDTEKSSYWLKHVFEWLDKNYELKEKE